MATYSIQTQLFERCLNYCTSFENGSCVMETICKPMSSMQSYILTFITILGILVFLLICILYVRMKEKKEQKKLKELEDKTLKQKGVKR